MLAGMTRWLHKVIEGLSPRDSSPPVFADPTIKRGPTIKGLVKLPEAAGTALMNNQMQEANPNGTVPDHPTLCRPVPGKRSPRMRRTAGQTTPRATRTMARAVNLRCRIAGQQTVPAGA